MLWFFFCVVERGGDENGELLRMEIVVIMTKKTVFRDFHGWEDDDDVAMR